MRKIQKRRTPVSICDNRSASALPEAVRELADLLALIAVQLLRNQPVEKDAGSRR